MKSTPTKEAEMIRTVDQLVVGAGIVIPTVERLVLVAGSVGAG